MLPLTISIVLALILGATGKRYDKVLYVKDAPDLKPLGLNATTPYCYSFTWVNKNENSFKPYLNKTCSEVYATTRPMPLCVDPMVATNNETQPNFDVLYPNSTKLQSLVCRPESGETCVKYSVIFDGAVQNVTRYCSKVKVDDLSMNSGCVTDDRGAYTKEVCACNPSLGAPCNTAGGLLPPSATLLTVILLYVLNSLRLWPH